MYNYSFIHTVKEYKKWTVTYSSAFEQYANQPGMAYKQKKKMQISEKFPGSNKNSSKANIYPIFGSEYNIAWQFHFSCLVFSFKMLKDTSKRQLLSHASSRVYPCFEHMLSQITHTKISSKHSITVLSWEMFKLGTVLQKLIQLHRQSHSSHPCIQTTLLITLNSSVFFHFLLGEGSNWTYPYEVYAIKMKNLGE